MIVPGGPPREQPPGAFVRVVQILLPCLALGLEVRLGLPPQDLVAAAAKKRAEEALAAQKRAEEVEAARKALAAQKRAETRARRSAAEKKAEAERAVAPDDGTLLDGGDEVSLDEPTN